MSFCNHLGSSVVIRSSKYIFNPFFNFAAANRDFFLFLASGPEVLIIFVSIYAAWPAELFQYALKKIQFNFSVTAKHIEL